MSNFTCISISLKYILCVYTDVDECATWIDDCHDYATCNNTMGSFECTCDEGFNGDGKNCTGEYESIALRHFFVKIGCPM